MKKNFKILIVDDAFFMRILLKKTLAQKPIYNNCSFDVVAEAVDGKEGIDLYKLCNAEIVTVDINMPQMNGIEFLKKIRKVNPNVYTIIISTTMNNDVKTELSKQNTFYLPKSFQPEFLYKILNEISDKYVQDLNIKEQPKPEKKVNSNIKKDDLKNNQNNSEKKNHKKKVHDLDKDSLLGDSISIPVGIEIPASNNSNSKKNNSNSKKNNINNKQINKTKVQNKNPLDDFSIGVIPNGFVSNESIPNVKKAENAIDNNIKKQEKIDIESISLEVPVVEEIIKIDTPKIELTIPSLNDLEEELSSMSFIIEIANTNNSNNVDINKSIQPKIENSLEIIMDEERVINEVDKNIADIDLAESESTLETSEELTIKEIENDDLILGESEDIILDNNDSLILEDEEEIVIENNEEPEIVIEYHNEEELVLEDEEELVLEDEISLIINDNDELILEEYDEEIIIETNKLQEEIIVNLNKENKIQKDLSVEDYLLLHSKYSFDIEITNEVIEIKEKEANKLELVEKDELDVPDLPVKRVPLVKIEAKKPVQIKKELSELDITLNKLKDIDLENSDLGEIIKAKPISENIKENSIDLNDLEAELSKLNFGNSSISIDSTNKNVDSALNLELNKGQLDYNANITKRQPVNIAPPKKEILEIYKPSVESVKQSNVVKTEKNKPTKIEDNKSGLFSKLFNKKKK